MQKLKIMIINNMKSNISNSSSYRTSFTAKKSSKGKQPVPCRPCSKIFEKDTTKRARKRSNRRQGIYLKITELKIMQIMHT